MTTLYKQICIMAFGFFITALANAATTAPATATTPVTINTTTAPKQKNPPQVTRNFSLTTGIQYSQKVELEANSERERSTDIEFIGSYKINALYNVSAKTAFSQELNGPKNSSISDMTLIFGVTGHKFNEKLISTHSLISILPLSKDSTERDHLRAAIGVANGISYNGDLIKVGYSLTISKNFHEYSQNADGTFLNEYGLNNSLSLAVPITEKFSISASGIYRARLTYENIPKYSFIADGDLNYDFTEKLSANLGMTNEGSALKSNGVDSNISLYNEAAAVFRTGLTYVY